MALLHKRNEDVPIDHELADRVGWFIQLRWLAGAAVLLGATAAWIGAAGTPTVGGLYGVGAAILAYNALLVRRHRSLAGQSHVGVARWRLFAHMQVALDWVALTVLSALTGGLESPLILFFTLHVILAAMLLPRRECLIQTSLGLLPIAMMAHWPHTGVYGHLGRSHLAVVQVYGSEARVAAYGAALAGMLYVCAFLASSIAERMRLRERELVDSRDSEARMYAHMALLHELAKSITATLDLDLVLQRVAEQATLITGSKACSIRLLSDSGELYVNASYGLSEEYLGKGPVDLARSPIDRKALLGEPVLVDDIAADGMFQYPEEALREGIRSVLCVTLLAQDQVHGVVRVYAEESAKFSGDDIQFLRHFASLAAIAINNARACRRLEDADRERARFVRTVAHELRAPLAAILGNVRIILDGYAGPISEKTQQLLDRAHHRGSLLLSLVRDLLALASRRPADDSHVREPVSLAETVRQVAGDLAAQAQARSLTVTIDADAGSAVLQGDREHLERLVVSNAVKYTPDRGCVRVRIADDGESIVMVVEDTGIGIPRALQDRIFEEFFRAENARRLTEDGTGLGLAIVKRIVDEHRGQIAVESEEGRGTRVTVVFPRYPEDAPEPCLQAATTAANEAMGQ